MLNNEQVNIIVDSAYKEAKRNNYEDFIINNIYEGYGVFPITLDVSYKWIQPEYKINEPEYETEWHCGFNGSSLVFEY